MGCKYTDGERGLRHIIVGGAAGSGGAGKEVKEGIRTYDMCRAREGEQNKTEEENGTSRWRTYTCGQSEHNTSGLVPGMNAESRKSKVRNEPIQKTENWNKNSVRRVIDDLRIQTPRRKRFIHHYSELRCQWEYLDQRSVRTQKTLEERRMSRRSNSLTEKRNLEWVELN
ncbi:hypothetical protein B0H14DRAFT_3780168 [Mycena olivaceomarginata]|nr:hypothetical protein B0H14DRAFT_3780168 [Mycena olivaceomarginata]